MMPRPASHLPTGARGRASYDAPGSPGIDTLGDAGDDTLRGAGIRYAAIGRPPHSRPFTRLLARAAARTVETWTRERFTLGDEVAVQVFEIACRLPGCPPLQTVVLWQPPDGPARRFKVFRPLAQLRRDDLPPRWMRDRLPEADDDNCC